MEHATIKFRKAEEKDSAEIWEILQQAIARRKADGSEQWQHGYPNPDTVKDDISKGFGFVLTEDDKIAAYSALIENYEPAYENIDGKWLSDGDFMVIHRVAVSDKFAGRGYATEIFRKIEEYASQKKLASIKVDTNFDNLAMLRILEKLGYNYCGEVFLMNAPRKAFEKVL